MGGEALGPGTALCPSVGECKGREVVVGGLVSGGKGVISLMFLIRIFFDCCVNVFYGIFCT